MEHTYKIMESDLPLLRHLKTFTCPMCGKALINLSTEENKREFWCDCNGNTYIVEIVEDED